MNRIKTAVISASFALMSFALPVYATDGGHWYDAFSWLGDIANFIKYLFVPPDNYLHNRLAVLNNLVNEKFSGLAQLYQTLNDFFQKLSSPASGELRFHVPDNFLFSGYTGVSFDVLSGASTYIDLLRGALTAFFFLFTVIVCYHKIRTFFTEEE